MTRCPTDVLGLASIPVDFSPHCRTSSQWTALGFIYDEPPIFPWLPPKPPRLVVEPDYFALAAALNLAAAYHPHRDHSTANATDDDPRPCGWPRPFKSSSKEQR